MLGRVPLQDPVRQYRILDAELGPRLRAVLERGTYILGPEVHAFEDEFARYCGAAGCVAVANGTDALELSLRAAGCGPGDEVITVANAGGYATTACNAVGAVPVFADISGTTGSIDPLSVRGLVSERTRAVVVTHLYGIVADVEGVRAQLGRSAIAVVEDGAQAHGGELRGRRVGSLGDLAAFSFYPTKNLGALGDGGAVTSMDPRLLDAVRELRQYGWTERFIATRPGGRNSRLDELQAAVLRTKLPHVDRWNEDRRSICDAYRKAAGSRLDFLHSTSLAHVGHLCVARHERRDALRSALDLRGIATAIHYPRPDHLQDAFAHVLFRHEGLQHTERAATEVFSLPCFPELTDREVQRVCEALDEALDEVR